MVDGLHIHTLNKMMKPFATALSGVGKSCRGRDDGGNLTNL
jgi:hypothetical protein